MGTLVRFLLGRSGAGKSESVLSEIRERAAAGADGLLLLVPEFVSHAVERALIEHAGNRLASHAEVLTLHRLCERVALEAGVRRESLDAGERMLLMYAACKRVEGSLRVLNRGLRPEFLSELLSMADECKSSCITPETLLAASNAAPTPLAGKLADLAAILAAYQGVLGETRLDTTDAITRLCEDAKKIGFFRGHEVWVDGFSGFSVVEQHLLSLLFSQAAQVTVTLCADLEDPSPMFRRANETYAHLKTLCGRCHTDILRAPHRTADPALQCLERGLFDRTVEPLSGTVSSVSLYAAPTPFAECELAAAKIKALVRDQGYRYREIAIAARGFETYAETLEAVLAYYEIPVYLNRKTNLLEKPVIALALSALDCICDHFRYDDVLCYLKSGLCGLSRAASDQLENYLYTWNIHGKDWTDEAGFSRSPGGTSPRADDEAVLLRLNRLRAKVREPLLALRSALRTDKTGAGFSRAMIAYFEALHLPRRLRARARLFRMRGELQLADEYRQLWEILLQATESIGKTLADYALDLRELIRLFQLTVTQFEIGTIPVSLDRVTAGDIERLGEPHPRVLLLLGCNDGVLPKAVSDSGLLSELDRARLSALDITLPQSRDRLSDDELAYAYRAISYPSERLIVTYAEGELLPSFLFSRVQTLLPGAPYACWIDTIRAESEAPALDAAMNRTASFSDTASVYFATTDRAELLSRAKQNAALTRGPITNPDTRIALFGSDIRLSASRLDSFESCRYQYFLKYGLKLRPRRVAEFDPLASGTFVHAILEKTLRELTARGGVGQISREDTVDLARQFADSYATEQLGGLAQHTARFCSLFFRLRDIACSAVGDLYDELVLSAFRPIDFELSFSDQNGALPAMRIEADGHTLTLQGVVDRVDGREVDGTLYLRVLDYKTGSKDFSFEEVLNGLGMQLLLYLFALEEAGPARYGKPVAPAGVLYVPIREERLRCDLHPTEADVAPTTVRKGLLVENSTILESHRFLPVSYKKDGTLSSRSQVAGLSTFYRMRKRMYEILGTVGTELSTGVVDANPYFTKTKTACTYCDYHAVCHFDPACGDRMRPLFAVTQKDLMGGETDV